jgi:hypothetical protein
MDTPRPFLDRIRAAEQECGTLPMQKSDAEDAQSAAAALE